MDIFKEINENISIEESKAVKDNQLVYDNSSLITGLVSPNVKSSEYLESAKGWVYAAVTAIADEVGNIDIDLYKKNKDRVEKIEQHGILDLIYKVNNYTTKFDFFWLISQYLDLTGEAPLFISYVNNEPAKMILLRPDKLQIKIGGYNIIEKYVYTIDRGKTIDLREDEVILIKLPDPNRQFRGKGTLEAAATTYDIEQFSEEYNRKFYFNSAQPDSVLTTDKKLTKDQREYLEKKVKEKYKGLNNSHKTMILEQGLDWKPMALSQRDMDFIQQQKYSRDKLLGIFKVPKSVLGLTEDVNRANAESSAFTFARWNIKPRMKRIIEQLNEFLLPKFNGTDDMFLDFKDPVPENRDLALREYESALKNGYMTINEVREKENLETIGEAGDKIYIPLNMYPIEGVRNTGNEDGESSKHVEAIKQLNARNKNNRKRKEITDKVLNEAKEEVAKRLQPIVKGYLELDNNKKSKKNEKEKKIEKKEVKKEKKTEYKEEYTDDVEFKKKNIFEKAVRRVHQRMETKYKDLVEKQLRQQEKKILDKLNKKDVNVKNFKLDPDEEKKIALQLYTPTEAQIIEEQSKIAYGYIGQDDKLDLDNPEVRRFIDNRISKFSQEMTKTTNKKISSSLSAGIKNGESIPQLSSRIRSEFDDMSVVRSKRIARTETTEATGWAAEQSYKESRVVAGKEWLTAYDERTCPYCEYMNGKTISLGGNYYNKGESLSKLSFGFGSIKAPPLHANCRCTLIPVLDVHDNVALKMQKLVDYKSKNTKFKRVLKDSIHDLKDADLPSKAMDKIKTVEIVNELSGTNRVQARYYYAGKNKGKMYVAGDSIMKNGTDVVAQNIIAHEVGHNVFHTELSKEMKKEFLDYNKEARENDVRLISRRAADNPSEHFAEGFQTYYLLSDILKKTEPKLYKFMSRVDKLLKK